MSACVICHFEILADDIVLSGGARRCVCLSCYERETQTHLTMPKPLRRQLTAILDAIPEAPIIQHH